MLTYESCIDRSSSPASPASVAATPHPYHYVIVREDLPIGFAMAQVTHAAGESACDCQFSALPADTYVRVLGVRDEDELLQVSQRLDARGVAHVLICEPDAPWCNQATAIGIPPTFDIDAIRRCTSHLPRAFKERK